MVLFLSQDSISLCDFISEGRNSSVASQEKRSSFSSSSGKFSISLNQQDSKLRCDLKKVDETSSVDSVGFSHLEWSASVPYNLAEEPDEVG